MAKRVYVSSTFIDLVAFRVKVLERLRRSKSIVVAMEDYAAFDERPADKCLADVKGCDIYVGILANGTGIGFLLTPKNWPASCSKPSSPRLAKTRLVFFGSKGRAGVFYGHRALNRTTSLGVTTGPDAEV